MVLPIVFTCPFGTINRCNFAFSSSATSIFNRSNFSTRPFLILSSHTATRSRLRDTSTNSNSPTPSSSTPPNTNQRSTNALMGMRSPNNNSNNQGGDHHSVLLFHLFIFIILSSRIFLHQLHFWLYKEVISYQCSFGLQHSHFWLDHLITHSNKPTRQYHLCLNGLCFISPSRVTQGYIPKQSCVAVLGPLQPPQGSSLVDPGVVG